jgi:hypothetical protein
MSVIGALPGSFVGRLSLQNRLYSFSFSSQLLFFKHLLSTGHISEASTFMQTLPELPSTVASSPRLNFEVARTAVLHMAVELLDSACSLSDPAIAQAKACLSVCRLFEKPSSVNVHFGLFVDCSSVG